MNVITQSVCFLQWLCLYLVSLPGASINRGPVARAPTIIFLRATAAGPRNQGRTQDFELGRGVNCRYVLNSPLLFSHFLSNSFPVFLFPPFVSQISLSSLPSSPFLFPFLLCTSFGPSHYCYVFGERCWVENHCPLITLLTLICISLGDARRLRPL